MENKEDDEDIKKYMEKFEKEMEQAIKKEEPSKLEPDIPIKPPVTEKPEPKIEEKPVAPQIPPEITPAQKALQERIAKLKEEKEPLEKESIEKVEAPTIAPKEEGLSESQRLLQERIEKERLEKERLERERLEKERKEKEAAEKAEKERLEKEMAEKKQLEELSKKDRVISNNMLFIMPSWGDLLGYPTNGTYVGQDVAHVSSDIVIFFASNELAVKTDKGTNYYVFGLGYYYTKFELKHDVELSRGKYIRDKRLLTGLVLSDFVYDHLASSKNITLESDRDVIVAEKVIKIPVDLSSKTEGQVTFIKGALMRNVFIPNKEIILEILDIVKNPDNYNIEENGHMLLSAHRDYFNKIIVSEQMKGHLEGGYMNQTAGLEEITYGADELLNSTLSSVEKQKIKEGIYNLKNAYSTLEFDHSYLYSILENVSGKVTSDPPPASIQVSGNLGIKESVLYSAEDRISSFIEWPSQFPRNMKEEVEVKPTVVQPEVLPDVKVVDPSIPKDYGPVKDYREPAKEEEKFVLRIDKSEKVESKPLPMPPEGKDIEEIFLYLKYVIEEDFEMPSVGRAFGLARDILPTSFRIANPRYTWEMSKIENLYIKKPTLMGLPPKEKEELLETVNGWLELIEEEKRKEQERIEAEKKRLEAERLEKERLERERQEQERLAAEKRRLEEERKERERLEKIRIQQEQVRKQREQERIEAERQEQLRQQREEEERARKEQESLEREKEKLKQIKAEKKRQKKLLKKKRKAEKKREKQRKKIESQKAKEEAELEEITQEFESYDS